MRAAHRPPRVGGAGKSWLARELAQSLDLPVVHLDRLYWKPGSVETPDPEWEALQRREVKRESWIADGLPGGPDSPDIWLDAADTISSWTSRLSRACGGS